MRWRNMAKAKFARTLRSTLCVAGLSIVPLGCASSADSINPQYTSPLSTIAKVTPPSQIQLVKADGADTPAKLPEVGDTTLPQPQVLVHPVPITLGTIFRLAEDQNTQIALSRAKIDEAYANK